MTATTEPQVIDILLTGIRSVVIDLSIPVFDGYPPGANLPVILVAVGGLSTPTAAGVQEWAYLGARSKFEKYKIEITVSVCIGGDGGQAEVLGADAQKAARDMAYPVVHAIENYLQGDPTLGQFFNTAPGLGGGWISLTDMVLKQTDDATAAIGAIAAITLEVEVYCRIV